MRIAHITLGSIADRVTGYTVRTEGALEAQRAAGWEPRLFALGRVERHHAMREAARHRVIGLPYSLEWAPVKALADFRPDVLHAHGHWFLGCFAEAVSRDLGVPWVYEVRGMPEGDHDTFASQWRAEREVETCNAANGLLVITEALAEDLRARGVRIRGLGFSVAPNGATPPADGAVRARPLRVGYLGTYRPLEGVAWMVRAIAAQVFASSASLNHIEVVLGGKLDADTKAAVEYARARGVYVCETGPVDPADRARWYEGVDLVVIPRPRQRTTELVSPLKPFEALAYGKPVLASRLPALEEVLGGMADYYTPGDAGSLWEGLCRRAPHLLDQSAWDWTRHLDACRRVYAAVGVAGSCRKNVVLEAV